MSPSEILAVSPVSTFAAVMKSLICPFSLDVSAAEAEEADGG